jgi:hypothetical protein
MTRFRRITMTIIILNIFYFIFLLHLLFFEISLSNLICLNFLISICFQLWNHLVIQDSIFFFFKFIFHCLYTFLNFIIQFFILIILVFFFLEFYGFFLFLVDFFILLRLLLRSLASTRYWLSRAIPTSNSFLNFESNLWNLQLFNINWT